MDKEAKAISDAFLYEVNGLLTDIKQKSSLRKQGSELEASEDDILYRNQELDNSANTHQTSTDDETRSDIATTGQISTNINNYNEDDVRNMEVESLRALVVWFAVSKFEKLIIVYNPCLHCVLKLYHTRPDR